MQSVLHAVAVQNYATLYSVVVQRTKSKIIFPRRRYVVTRLRCGLLFRSSGRTRAPVQCLARRPPRNSAVFKQTRTHRHCSSAAEVDFTGAPDRSRDFRAFGPASNSGEPVDRNLRAGNRGAGLPGRPHFAFRELLDRHPAVQSLYDPVRDFAPIILATKSPNILVVHPAVPTTSEGINRTNQKQARRTQLRFGWPRFHSSFGGRIIQSVGWGVNVVHIPYKGSGAALLMSSAAKSSDVRHRRFGNAASQSRQIEGTRGDQHRTLCTRARLTPCRGHFAGV